MHSVWDTPVFSGNDARSDAHVTGIFEVDSSREAKRVLSSDLSKKSANAAPEFIVGPMPESPKRVGRAAA
jgi:hypothetical protein